jgi:hypothetical protein
VGAYGSFRATAGERSSLEEKTCAIHPRAWHENKRSILASNMSERHPTCRMTSVVTCLSHWSALIERSEHRSVLP